MIFRNPLILAILPIIIFVFIARKNKSDEPGFFFPSSGKVKTISKGAKAALYPKLIYLRELALVLAVIALAGPQISREPNIKKEGIAIMIAVDSSSTMLANDIQLGFEDLAGEKVQEGNKVMARVDAVKEVAADFVRSRPNDIIGTVTFASEAFVACPLTFDHDWLLESLARIKVGMIKDGTAVGSGILSSLGALKDSDAKSKIIILLTDGINNSGKVPPVIAAKTARAIGVKIYTIGVTGKAGFVPDEKDPTRKVYKSLHIDIDDKTLKEISKLTDGRYFEANDMKTLRDSYKEIDKLEKGTIEEREYAQHEDVYPLFLLPALILVLLEIILSNTALKRIP